MDLEADEEQKVELVFVGLKKSSSEEHPSDLQEKGLSLNWLFYAE